MAQQLDAPREHLLVRRTRLGLQKIDDDIAEHLRQQAEIRERMRRGGPPDIPSVMGLYDAVGQGGVLQATGNVVAVIVTREQRPRALSVLGKLVGMLASRDLRLWVNDGKTFVGRKPYTFVFRLSEVAEKANRTPDVPYATYGWMPTGRLRITLRTDSRTDFRIIDEKTAPLEDQLESLIDFVAKAVKNGPEKDRRLAEWRADHNARVAEAQEAMRQAQQAKAQQELLEQMEAARCEDLRREAVAWREASDMRAYASALVVANPEDDWVRSWASWAMQVADVMDPMLRRLQQIEMGSAEAEPTGDGL